MLRLSSKPLAITSYKAFLKNKEVWNCLPASISAWFLKKNISIVIFYYLTIVCLPLLREILGNIFAVIVY